MSFTVTYQELCLIEKEFNDYTQELKYGSESGGVFIEVGKRMIDTLSKILIFVRDLIKKLLNWIAQQFTYDAHIQSKNLSRAYKIKKKYVFLDREKRKVIDDVFLNREIESAWTRDKLEDELQELISICKFTQDELIAAIKFDIANISSPEIDSAFERAMIKLQSWWRVSFNPQDKSFKITQHVDSDKVKTGTLRSLGYTSLQDLLNIMDTYQELLTPYRKVADVTSTVIQLEGKLRSMINNVNSDPYLEKNIQQYASEMSEKIKNMFKVLKNFVKFIRSLHTSLSIKVSNLLNIARDVMYRKLQGKTESLEPFMKEISIYVTNDEIENERSEKLDKIYELVNQFLEETQNLYQFNYIRYKHLAKRDHDYRNYCKGKQDFHVMLITLANPESIDPQQIKDFVKDMNAFIKDTGMVFSFNDEYRFIVSDAVVSATASLLNITKTLVLI